MTDDAPRHLWTTLGYRRTDSGEGTGTVAWTATEEYCFPSRGGPIVQGGMVASLLDAAMAAACWTVLGPDEAFATADLRIEFLRTSRPGELHAVGSVVRRTRRVVFCSADLLDESGTLLAASRCTQVVLAGDGSAGRNPPPGVTGGTRANG